MRPAIAALVVSSVLSSGAGLAADKSLYWGDVHLHTNLSFDAYINGTRTIGPAEAYQFAQGKTVVSNTGLEVQLKRPLDFLAVTDHTENMGLYTRIDARDPLVVGTSVAQRYTELLSLFKEFGLRGAFMRSMRSAGPLPDMPALTRNAVWDEVTTLADDHNQPGKFTTLIGYEWTAMITGDNLHRVVLYRDGAELAMRRLPLEASSDPDPESLWAELERYETETGGNVLAIAHNGNLSNGRMFANTRLNGGAIDRNYAERRARWEPVYEVTQVKGDGETHPALSPGDSYADFETWDRGNVAGTEAKTPDMLDREYARSALMAGLAHEQSIGANPFRFGLIGSTDSHTGLSATREDNFLGKFAGSEPSVERLQTHMAGMADFDRELAASGLIAVWAEENTRGAIFDAIKRREVYATTGSRIGLRVHAGWNYKPSDVKHHNCLSSGCSLGVPMGATLGPTDSSDAPTFLVDALKDPLGADLERVQVVKGWVDNEGNTHEKVYDVIVASSETQDGVAERSVLPGEANDKHDQGAAALSGWWQDPDFNPAWPAFYYVRVLEVPAARWTTRDAVRYDVPAPQDVPAFIQDRAYSSPIWYQPPTVD